MSEPIISIYKKDNATSVTTWDLGEQKASNESPVLEVLVWNNRGGTVDVSDVKETVVTCLDADGGDTSEMTTGHWMKVLVDSTATVDAGQVKQYSEIGGAKTWPVRANGLKPEDGQVIRGTKNDGTVANAAVNVSSMAFKIVIPQNAKPGDHNFRIEVRGYYT